MDVNVHLCGLLRRPGFTGVFLYLSNVTEITASFCKKGLHQKTLWNLKQLNHLYVDLHNERSAGLDCNHFLLLQMTDPENSHNALHAQYIYTLHAP